MAKKKNVVKKSDIIAGPSFGDGIPAKHTSWRYDPNMKRIRIKSQSEWNENGVGTCPIRTIDTQIVYAQHARELARWLNKVAKMMEKQ